MLMLCCLFRWARFTEARGDYPSSHHKLIIQFYEASAAQDRKLEGLVHKAILELWRPNPTEVLYCWLEEMILLFLMFLQK